MKLMKTVTVGILTLALLCPLAGLAAEQKAEPKPKPYPLKTCIVSGEKLGEMGKAYVFVYQGREIKLCCKNCLKDFNKDAAKYVKKIDAEAAKAKGKAAKPEAK